MIHTFKCLDLYMLIDVESGAVHVVDELVHEVVKLYLTHSREEVINSLKDRFSVGEIEEVYDELNQLRQNDLLCTQTNKEELEAACARNKNVIKALCLHVAHDCNLRCKYCFASTGDFHGDRMMMPIEVAKAALDFLMEKSGNRQHLEVDFFGGEPLMNFDVVKETVAYGRELEKRYNKNIRFTITTNGLLLNDETMDFINKELYNVVISLDGRKDIHDMMRKTVNNRPSFSTVAIKSLALTKTRGEGSHYIRGTFTSYNLDFSKDVEFLSDYGFKQLSLEPVVAEASQNYAITEVHLERIKQEYEKLAQLYLERLGTEKEFNFFHFNLDLTGGPCLPKRVTGCGAGNEYVAIAPTGDIYPCHQFVGTEEYRMGNVLAKEFSQDKQDEFKRCNVLTKPECNKCWAKYYCSGGCAANAYHYNNDIYQPYKIGCELEKKRIECSLAIYAKKKGL